MTTRQLIVNADDFGRSNENDNAILTAHAQGIVSSLSVFATHDIFHSSVGLLKKTSNLGIAVHLDISSGSHVAESSSIKSLIDGSGRFFVTQDQSAFGKIDPHDLEIEFTSQIEKCLDAGLALTHLDNHRPNIYFYPRLFAVVVSLAAKFNLALRSPFDDSFETNVDFIAKKYNVTPQILLPIASKSKTMISEAKIRTSNNFIIFDEAHRSPEGFIDLLKKLKPGVTELCTHPGAIKPEECVEGTILSSPYFKAVLRDLEIELVNYAHVK